MLDICSATNKDYYASTCRWKAVNLLSYVLGKTTNKDAFYSRFKFKISFNFRSLLEWEWLIRWQQLVVSMVLRYSICRSYSVEYLQLSLCLSILKAHMNLNGMQRLYGIMGRKWLDTKFQVLIKCVYLEHVV